MNAIILSVTDKSLGSGNLIGYFVGVIIALLILAYLIYSLIKPEEF